MIIEYYLVIFSYLIATSENHSESNNEYLKETKHNSIKEVNSFNYSHYPFQRYCFIKFLK